LEFAARYCTRQKRVFLADGDVLIMPMDRLCEILSKIREKLPWVNRVSLYGNAKSILRKTAADLKRLKSLGLDRVYMGLESGHNSTLKRINKGVNVEQMIQAAGLVRNARLFLSVTVLLGIAGVEKSQEHAIQSGKILTAMAPNQIAALTLMVLENTPLYQDQVNGSFQLPDPKMLLAELKTMVQNIDLDRVQLQANHASNYLPIVGRLTRDREKIMEIIDNAIAGRERLTPEYQRAL
jgi:coproporphyrinogen III oxidase-like Fe-S oxidoreductase